MVWFFFTIALLSAATVALVVWPLMRTHSVSQDHRKRQNVKVAQDRLQELETNVAQGTVPSDQALEEQAEIELALLDDVSQDDGVDLGGSRQGWWAGAVVAVLVPLMAGALYLSLGEPAALRPPTSSIQPQPGHSGADILNMVRALEQRLATTPDDAEGWYVLGNSYMTLKQYDKAAAAYATLRKLKGDQADLLVRHADALAMSQGGALAGEPEQLILFALERQPDHPVALWLAGIAADRRGDIQAALRYWQRARPLFQQNPESQKELENLIAQAKAKLADKPDPTSASNFLSDAKETEGGNTGTIKIKVSLDESLRAEVADRDTLFVLARAEDGPPMPLAVIRKQASDLPLSVTLDDSMAMVPNMTLSQYDAVLVVARISKSGQTTAASGDLFGQVSAVSPGTDRLVDVVISKRVP